MTADLPPPLVADEVEVPAGFVLDAVALVGSELVALSTPEEFKAAVLLWCWAWKQHPPGSLPRDEKVLASFARVQPKRWAKVRAMALRGFIECADGRLYHPRLATDAIRVWKARLQRRNALARRYGQATAEATKMSSPGAPVPDPDPKKERKEKGLQEQTPKESPAPSALDRIFDEQFWPVFPRKAGKIAARKAWHKAVANGGIPAEIIAGATRFSDDPNRDPAYTPHPATWLNAGCWTDDPLPAKTSTSKGNGRGSRWDEIFRGDRERTDRESGKLAEGVADPFDLGQFKSRPLPAGDQAPVADDAQRGVPAVPPNESVPAAPGRASGGGEG